MWNYCLLEVENPTDGQLIYMKDIYSEEVLINYMVRRWERKFFHMANMEGEEYKQYRHEIELLKLDSYKVLASMEDY